jgi:hypothetical protein
MRIGERAVEDACWRSGYSGLTRSAVVEPCGTRSPRASCPRSDASRPTTVCARTCAEGSGGSRCSGGGSGTARSRGRYPPSVPAAASVVPASPQASE